MVKERPTTLQAITPNNTISHNNIVAKNTNKPKKKKNIFGLLLLGIIATVVAGGAFYLNQNPDLPWKETSLETPTFKQKVEQLIDNN